MAYKHLFLDFDGVLTDNHVYVDQNGLEAVRCSKLDGQAISEIKKLGVTVVIISAEYSDYVLHRGSKLDITAYCAVLDKEKFLKQAYGDVLHEAIYVGDSLADVLAGNACKLFLTPKDSIIAGRAYGAKELETLGGQGICWEILLKYF